ncbi:catalytic domain of components of various dehydrogenase complexes [Caldicellulosiruptor saccharolyticus DSM 8903]|uniref:Dihydrolipoamide acetyltransferase component of pyruvate dehydrogenase complex n=1 Tax=Caldicellulosiruptor saccharolyticus (strain ATCC 43494 / DSM 8903 / Tp8T 6331) TaxID=351627 RepID=A4XHV3_CALS8|nr:dihydrolipoamide acetyltransferase family protein [Caldicellulosiruptor saccharolyticus]ABP66488.1 catalytic domain of components of various dehydrogenase complexes [Caldicellulosiruptor saccharolyticus DSM 8903]
MATPVIMPKQGQTVESCIITKWHKKKGEKVEVGDLLFSYETDKASFDEEAKVSGILLDIFFEEGEEVPVLTNVAVIGQENESADIFNPKKGTDATISAESPGIVNEVKKGETVSQDRIEPKQVLQSSDKIRISPRAKKLAEKLNVDFRFATPSGPEGRIIERDILELFNSGYVFTSAAKTEAKEIGNLKDLEPSGIGGRITISDIEKAKESFKIQKSDIEISAQIIKDETEYEEAPLSNIRKTIAKAMYLSLTTTAQLTLHTSFDASNILEFRKRVKENREKLGLEDITINDIILFAVSRVLPKHKALNAHFLDDKMRYFKNVHLGFAVDTERGLMVPTIFNSNKKSLNQISKEAKELIQLCRKGTINPDLLKGATFTVTNLGSFGIEGFTPVLNPPQTGILGVNTIVMRAKEQNGQITYYPAIGLSLTFDHRALDGADAARFLQDLKKWLENFELLLAL